MAKIFCTITETILENDSGIEVPSVVATCPHCGHTTESFGIDGRSKRRCLLYMNRECPNGQKNLYVEGHSPESLKKMIFSKLQAPSPSLKIIGEI